MVRYAAQLRAGSARASRPCQWSLPAGDFLDAPPARIVIAFSQELDQTQIDATSVRLEVNAPAMGVDLSHPCSHCLRAGRQSAHPGSAAAAPLTAGRHYRVVVGGLTHSALSGIGGDRLVGSDGSGATVISEFDVAAAP